jgi:hypothetical protein
VTAKLDLLEIIHPGAPELGIGPHESARADHVGGHAEAGAKAQHGPAILGDVGLEKGEAHGGVFDRLRGARPVVAAARKCLARLRALIIPIVRSPVIAAGARKRLRQVVAQPCRARGKTELWGGMRL